MTRIILWFRNDLRLHDNYIINYAMNMKSSNKEIIPVYCFDPRIFNSTTKYNTRKTGIVRANFILQSVLNLRNNL